MRLKQFTIVIFLLSFCSCSLIQKKDKQLNKTENLAYFVSSPIAQFSSFQSPCIHVEIEGETLLLKLDLGFQGDMVITEEAINSIVSKTFIGQKSTYGIRGKEYKKNLYQVPKAKIGTMTFFPITIEEENEEFLKDAEFFQTKDNSPSREEIGRLGWELFCNTNVLIDLQNSRIAFCDSLNTLKKENYEIETFVKTPLLLERNLVEFDANTPNGPIRCVLDTGTTWNVSNAQLESGESIDVAVWKSENILEYPFFKIGGGDFGPISFHRMPIQIPIRIEAILGMEFFRNHLVFLDFSERYVYFAKNHRTSFRGSEAITENPKSQ